jgi:hypothetical protein
MHTAHGERVHRGRWIRLVPARVIGLALIDEPANSVVDRSRSAGRTGIRLLNPRCDVKPTMGGEPGRVWSIRNPSRSTACCNFCCLVGTHTARDRPRILMRRLTTVHVAREKASVLDGRVRVRGSPKVSIFGEASARIFIGSRSIVFASRVAVFASRGTIYRLRRWGLLSLHLQSACLELVGWRPRYTCLQMQEGVFRSLFSRPLFLSHVIKFGERELAR